MSASEIGLDIADQYIIRGLDYLIKSTFEAEMSPIGIIKDTIMEKEEPRPAARHSLIHSAADKDDDANAAAQVTTETDDIDIRIYCRACRKHTDHDTFTCLANSWTARKYCMICNKRSDHLTEDCPKATKDLLAKLRYCNVCRRNTDHHTFNCPHREKECVWHNGILRPNFCDFCSKKGHLDLFCPLNRDDDDDDVPRRVIDDDDF